MSEHAHCGPSSSEGWLNCSSYATLTRGLQRKATYYTREGSAAHKVAELKLEGKPIPTFIEIEGEEILITEEMLDYVDVYVQFAQLLMFGATLALVEAKVRLDWLYEPLSPPEEVFGTADLIVYDESIKTLYVVDFKYGAGHVVSAKRNPQLMFYALMALGILPETPVNIALIIVQPRASHNQISRDDMLLSELTEWFQNTVKPALARIGAGDTSENSGDWCRWCQRLSQCATIQQKAQSVAKLSFSEESETPSPVAPGSLSSSEISNVLEQAELISAWVSKVRAEAMARIENGETLPGWKTVAKRGIRKWVDVTEAEIALYSEGLERDEMLETPQLKSPAQMEKLLKRKGLPIGVMDALVTKESSGVSLVRDTDDREEVKVLRVSASSVFDAVSDGE